MACTESSGNSTLNDAATYVPHLPNLRIIAPEMHLMALMAIIMKIITVPGKY